MRVLKLAVVAPAIALTPLAYSSAFGGDPLLATAVGIILLGLHLLGGSASGTVFLSTVLYSVPYAMALSGFLRVAFPQAHEAISEAVLNDPYFSSPAVILSLIGLSVLAEYADSAEGLEKALGVPGWRVFIYALPVVVLALLVSTGLMWLGRSLNITTGGIVLPLLLLLLGIVLAYSSVEGGRYGRVIAAVEVPPMNGEVVIETSGGEKSVPISRSSAFEWDTLRLEVELEERPKRVRLRNDDGERILIPLIESTDGKTLFLLYRVDREG
ncbi:hypothetical protein CL1_1278 [Thermococcus cleftensis]|uniref:Uncharacterized protein n=1 Tax=Thermococcus cleftensis (strain DSM 27260 / KACC 17922 / CL1) TaxID=163003 RepID=I3ZUU3_THECF|nr:hypothetical protein [Thermococcus cleftensis]AFL95477.1 hypothetical protein CL1_1278 [Thermococcus cleftensis]